MKLLFIGDIVGRPGRDLVRVGLAPLVACHAIDLVIVNGENSAGGNGITREIGDSLFAQGVDVITSGNHIWDKREALDYIKIEPRLLRPANYPDAPGRGSYVARTPSGRSVAVLNVMGRVHLANIDDPFQTARREIDALRQRTPIVFVDFHAEATSEKIAMGWFLDGSVTAVVGTHTHVQTADEQIFPGGTAFLCDAGMCGPVNSILGRAVDPIVNRFITNLPALFPVAKGEVRLCGAVVSIDETTGRALSIKRVNELIPEPGAAPPSTEKA